VGGAGGGCLGWPAAAARRRVGRHGAGPLGLRQQVGVLAHAVAGAFDLHDHGVVQQAVEQGGGDHGIAEYFTMPSSLIVWSVALGLPAVRFARRAA